MVFFKEADLLKSSDSRACLILEWLIKVFEMIKVMLYVNHINLEKIF